MICIYTDIHTRESPTIAKRRSNIRCTRPNIEDLTAHYSGLEAGQEVDRNRATRMEVEQLCKLAKHGKALGLDGIQATCNI